MEELTPKQQFLQSLDRCIQDENFIPEFYKHFLSTSDEVRSKFRHTDFEEENKMLLRSLRLSAGATAGDSDSLRELRERARTHNRDHLNIGAELYDLWLDSVIATARKYDDKWDETIEATWKTTLGYVVQYMIKHY